MHFTPNLKNWLRAWICYPDNCI